MTHTCALVGAGHRAMAYASYGLELPDRMQVVAVADPSEQRRARAARVFDLEKRDLPGAGPAV